MMEWNIPVAEPAETIEVAEMAAVLKCSEAKVEAALRTGLLPSVQIGRSHVVPRRAFFLRLDEIALEQAAARRSPAPMPTPSPAPAERSTGRLRGRRGALPTLPEAVGKVGAPQA